MSHTSRDEMEKAIFHTVRAIPDEVQRESYLKVACGDDRELRIRVDSLIAAVNAAGEFLESPPVDSGEFVASDVDDVAGTMIGPYKLLEQIGEGGFGVVYMADQIEPIRRRVALKIIKAGMDTKQVVARFEAERQALALMDHPNIAKVFEAGATETGRPYFVMELVRGVPVIEYCDQRSLSTGQRLRIFVDICSAIQHAHQKGIIHRDIKPSNILVSTDAESPVPHVIDFGIAKATQGNLTDKTLFTQFRQFVGTPAYMSPEQAQMTTIDVDTRSDLYSLGVLLYELLTGKTPFDSEELKEAGFEEVCRHIRDEVAPTPSKRISSLRQEELVTLAKNRRVDVADVSRLIRGDLDWIVMKAIDKDRSRRYSTADALAEDIRRHLHHEPVFAVPPSMAYLARKFIGRNRGLLTTVGITVSLLLIATVVSTLLAFSANHARKQLSSEVEAKTEAVKRAEASESEAILAKKRIEKNLYFHRIARALREWLTNDVARAEQLFSECALEHRGWEWEYLNQLFHANRRVLNEGFSVQGAGCRDISYSPDGRFIVCHVYEANKTEGELLFWNAHTGERVPPLCPIEDGAITVAFSSDSKRLAVTYANPGGVGVWDIETHRAVFHFRQDSLSNQLSVAFNPLGDRIVSTSFRGPVYVWDLEKQEQGLVLKCRNAVRAKYSPDGRSVASAGRDGTVRIWDANTGESVHVLKANSDVRDLAFSPDSQSIVTGGYARPKQGFWNVWNLKADPPSVSQHPMVSGAIRRVDYTSDGAYVLLGLTNGRVRICEPSTGFRKDMLHAHNSGVLMALRADSQRLVTCGANDGQVKQWDMTRRFGLWGGAEIPREDLAWVRGAAFNPHGTEVALAGGHNSTRRLNGNKTIQLWDISDIYHPQMSREFGGQNGPLTSVAYSADGRLIAAGSNDHVVRVWEASSGELLSELAEHEATVTAVLFLGQFLVSASADQTIKVWNLESGEARTLVGHEAGVNCVAASPDQRFVASGGDDKTVRLWDFSTGDEVRTLNTEQSVTSVAWSRDGRWIAAGLANGTARTWEIETGLATDGGKLDAMQVVHRHDLNAGELEVQVAFHPRGNRLATVSSRPKLWDVQTGQEAFAFPDRVGSNHSVSFSADGNLFLVARHNEVIVWEARGSQSFPDGTGRQERRNLLNWHLRQLVDCRRNANWFGVTVHADKSIDLDPTDATHYSTRAQAHVQREMWVEAAADLVKVSELQAQLQTWYDLTYLHLRNGNHQAYQDACGELLKLLDRDNASMANSVAWRCSLGEQAVSDPSMVVAISEQAVALAPSHRRVYYLNTLGAALYRAGRFEASIERLNESIDAHGKGGYPENWLFLSMVHSQLEQSESAQNWLDKAKAWIDERISEGESTLLWNRRIGFQLLTDEAESLITREEDHGEGLF